MSRSPRRTKLSGLSCCRSMSTGQGQGRLTESRRTLSQTDAIAAVTTFYGKTAREKTASPSKTTKKKKSRHGSNTTGADRDDALDLSDSETIEGSGEVLASVLGLPPRVM